MLYLSSMFPSLPKIILAHVLKRVMDCSGFLGINHVTLAVKQSLSGSGIGIFRGSIAAIHATSSLSPIPSGKVGRQHVFHLVGISCDYHFVLAERRYVSTNSRSRDSA